MKVKCNIAFDEKDMPGKAVYISNHVSYLDLQSESQLQTRGDNMNIVLLNLLLSSNKIPLPQD